MPSDHSPALVLNGSELRRLQERVKQLEVEKQQQTEVYNQARQQHIKLIQERKDMNAEIQRKDPSGSVARGSSSPQRAKCTLIKFFCVLGVVLEKLCNQLMMRRFGREVDLEVLQTLSGNRTVEELKQEKLLQEAAYAKEIKQWDVRASWRVLRLACLGAFYEL